MNRTTTALAAVALLTSLTGLGATGSVAAADACPDGSGHISGTLTDADTGALVTAGTSVEYSLSDGTPYDGGNTDGNGFYTQCVPANDYIIKFVADGYVAEWFDDAFAEADAAAFTVVAGLETIIDEDLVRVREYSISGRVTDADGNGIRASISIETVAGDPIDGEGTDVDGFYEISFLAPGDYLISFSEDGFWSEWYDDERRRSKATVLTVGPDAGDLTGIDAELRRCRGSAFCIPRNFDR